MPLPDFQSQQFATRIFVTSASMTKTLLYWPKEDFDRKLTVISKKILECGISANRRQLKRLEKSVMYSVKDGVVEVGTGGQVLAALDTEVGPMFISGHQRIATSEDPQVLESSDAIETAAPSNLPSHLLMEFTRSSNSAPARLVCEIEVSQFDSVQKSELMPLLLSYIHSKRNSDDRDELTAVASAIRKYIAIMPPDELGSVADLLAPANHDPLPLGQEIEIAKMVYRHFEVRPPENPDPFPRLSEVLLEMARAYTNPRILLRDKHSAAASLAIEAIIAMRSELSLEAWQLASECPYMWFGEMVSDDLLELERQWCQRNADAATWISGVRSQMERRGEESLAQHT